VGDCLEGNPRTSPRHAYRDSGRYVVLLVCYDYALMILKGHTHLRFCSQFDSNSMSLESGRFMETVGECISYLRVKQNN
jgi:hypothetical protein